MRRAWSSLLVLSLCACSSKSERAHIFLVTADTLRSDHLSFHGYPRDTAPRLAAFAREAWDFTQALTVLPKTGPSFTTHFSGLHPEEHGVVANRYGLPQDLPWLAELLQQAGYTTAAFVSNPVLAPEKGYARGFDHYRLFGEDDALEDVNAAFADWVAKQDSSRPVFAWVHYIDPHGPYTPPERWAGLFQGDELERSDTRRVALDYEHEPGWPSAFVLGAVPRYQRQGDEDRVAAYVRAYDAEIRYMDEMFGRLVDLLQERGLFDESSVLFTSDHGESLGEHDYYFEHGWQVYEGSLRIPLVIKPPRCREARSIDAVVSNLDTLPTLLALAGLEPVAGQAGRNLLGQPPAEEPLLLTNTATYPERFFGARTARYKYVRAEESRAEELYDLSSDPLETSNRAADPSVEDARALARLRRDCEDKLAILRARRRAAVPHVVENPGVREHLQELGYTDE
jgi:arylsulfatase A-like enzyme